MGETKDAIKKFFYVVEPETQPGDGHMDNLTGNKIISIYKIVEDDLELMEEFDVRDSADSEELVFGYLATQEIDIDFVKLKKL